MEQYVDRICVIGEVGLDFQLCIIVESIYKDIQRNVLKMQVELVNKYDFLLNVYLRFAGKFIIVVLKEFGVKFVFLYVFDGRLSVVMEGVKEGYFFLISFSIVRSDQLKFVKQLLMENIVLEIDCFGLGLVKGERNEFVNVQIFCDYIVKVKNMIF